MFISVFIAKEKQIQERLKEAGRNSIENTAHFVTKSTLSKQQSLLFL